MIWAHGIVESRLAEARFDFEEMRSTNGDRDALVPFPPILDVTLFEVAEWRDLGRYVKEFLSDPEDIWLG
ncbi:hypothetical protein ASF58_16265 [Methylobacterium sp. Leaf125]|nr:hypothetical protein ASF58_16265 [Methylobacterium sp. Leaf125]